MGWLRSLVTLLWTVLLCGAGFLAGMLGLTTVLDFLFHLWARGACLLSGMKVEVLGESPNKGCLFVFNHSSHMDIAALLVGVHGRVRFGAKEELFRIPLFGATLRATQTLRISRQNRSQTLKEYDRARGRFAAGENFALAPEGTRSQDPCQLQDFKSGPFILAIEAQAKVVPVVIFGTHKVLPKSSLRMQTGFWSQKVIVKFLEPIDAGQIQLEGRRELKARVFAEMQTALASFCQDQKL